MNDIDRILARESVELLEAVRCNDAGARERLAKWMKQSRRHTEHYLMTVAFERELDQVRFSPELTVALAAPPVNVVALNPQPAQTSTAESPQRRTRHALAWSSAAVAASVVAAIVFHWHSRGTEYTTAVGEQRLIGLPDGSVVHLNTHSQVRVSMSEDARDIHLTSGEALFKVRQDSARPFRVHTHDAVIQAIGTEFTVHTRPAGTTVAVLEGRIRVNGSTTAEMASGEAARIDPDGRVETHPVADIERAAAWRERRLIFSATPLAEVVAEFNRYNLTPQLILEGEPTADQTFSGVFDADDPESLIQLLQREPGLRFSRQENSIVVTVGD